MRRAARGCVVAISAMVLVVTMAGPAAAKKVSPEKYAKSLCSTLNGLLDSTTELVDAYNALPVDDPATFQTQAIELANAFIADLEAAEAKLRKVTPDVSGGKKIGKSFVVYLSGQTAEVQAAVDTFATADPNGVAFAADVAAFEVAIQTLGVTASDPFSEVTNQDLLQAFDEEKSCEDIVTVF